MRNILLRINKVSGVRGTLVVGQDGLLMAADMSGNEDPQALGAMASSVIATLTPALARMGQGQMSRFVMNGSEGSVILLAVESAILLTLLRKDANMGMVLVELKTSAQELATHLTGTA